MWRLSCLGPPVHSTGLEGETAGDVRHSTAPAGGQHCPAGALTRDAYAYLYLPMTQLPRIATSVSQPRRTSPGKAVSHVSCRITRRQPVRCRDLRDIGQALRSRYES
jgi:hypothetical protein